MKKLKKLFGGIEMTWPRVLLLAVLSAVYTALVNLLPLLKDTSFQDIAVYPDGWFLFALFIIVNCKKWYEAALKCFVFFLVSQPLIYLIEVPFYAGGFSIFQYYRRWFIITLFTFPGAAAAFFVKKKNWLSVAILSVAVIYLCYSGVSFLRMAASNFPYHLLSGVFSIALALFFIFVLLDEKKHRICALVIAGLILAGFGGYTAVKLATRTTRFTLDEGVWTCEKEAEGIVSVTIENGNEVTLKPVRNGNVYLYFTSADGVRTEYYVTVSSGGILYTEFAPE